MNYWKRMGKESRRKRVVVADDQPMLRAGLCRTLDQQADLMCCGEAASAPEVLRLVQSKRVDLVITDLRLKDDDGIELIKILRETAPLIHIVVFSRYSGLAHAERALRAGATGFVFKESAATEILEAVRRVFAGHVYVAGGLANHFLKRLVGQSLKKCDETRRLTNRELHILDLLGTGQSTREVAEALKISFKTVEAHRENIKRKLGLRTATALMRYAIEWAQKQTTASRTGNGDH